MVRRFPLEGLRNRSRNTYKGFGRGLQQMDLDWEQGELAEGLRCYREHKFFEAHEEWESVWLRAPEPEKTFLQGIIQIAAAFHHLQRKNPLGALRLLEGALRRLERYPESFGGLPAAALCDGIRKRLEALRRGASELEPVRIEPSSPGCSRPPLA